MRSESELVPYVPGRLDGSPVLVLAPHPDDEIFGCGGVLAQAVKLGATVRTVILTDGAAQGDEAVRRAEAEAAARQIGLPPPELWGLDDRSLRPDDETLEERLRTLLEEVAPHVLLVPSPAEVHPDHRALALVVYRILQRAVRGSELHAAVQAVRLAAYEVSAVLRPNLLVDVTAEWDQVLAAANAYRSQIEMLPYLEVLDGIASARRLTLPHTVQRAEAYHVVDLRYVRTHSASEWAAVQGPSVDLETSDGAAPIDVVLRTRNRPQLLAQALESLRLQLHRPRRVIVVNDGGAPVEQVCGIARDGLALELVVLDPARGRAAAAQAGLERATASHVVFLDDDDLLLPEHLLVLARAVARGVTVPYTDAVQGVWRAGGDGPPVPVGRHRTFGGDFDPARLTLINFIPLPCVAIPRELALEIGGFDREVDLYEDWDLLLRLQRRTPFVHLERVTVEYRTMIGGDGITSANPPGSGGQLAALEGIWRRHGLVDEPRRLAAGVMALVAERDRAAEAGRQADEWLLEERGARDGLEAELVRVQSRKRSLEEELRRIGGTLADAQARLVGVEQRNAELELAHTEQSRLFAEQERVAAEQRAALEADLEEVQRVLADVRASLTWRLYNSVERLLRRLRLR
jgi:LmbE family N-acetylglucosaminyl deacetylase